MPERIVDACCLINLYGSGKPIEILRDLKGEFYVPAQVRSEVLTIRRPDHEKPDEFVSEPIDLAEAIEAEAIRECRIEGENENECFVQYAMELDDGEAACLAIAKVRGWAIATDDKKAIRLAAAEQVPIVTTPELLHRWAEAAGPGNDVIAETLRAIEMFARFRPRKTSEHSEWWIAITNT